LGIIQKQTIKGTIYSYIGTLIGFINIGILSPVILSSAQIGLINLLVAISLIFAQFSSLGFNNVTTKLFTFFRDDKNKHHGFLFIALTVAMVGFSLSAIIFFVVQPYLIAQNIEKSPLFTEYIYYLLPLIFFTLIFNILDNYNKVLYDAVLGTFLKEIVFRILNTLIIVIYFLKLIDFSVFVFAYISALCLPAVIISIILMVRGQFSLRPQLDFSSKELKKTMKSVSFFGIIAGFSGILAMNIDKYMVNSMIDLKATGIYSITFYFGALIMIPSRTLIKISSVIIADAWKTNDTKTISAIYYKSTLNQFIIALLIFFGIWVNINNIFDFLPKEYIAGKYVIFFIGLANLLNMLSGVSGAIIVNSKYYKIQTFFIAIFAALIIITNYIFIPIWGLTGAAIASALSVLLFAIMRYFLLYKKFKMQPYNKNHLIALLIGLFAYFISYIIPEFHNFIIDIIIRSSVITLIFVSLIFVSKISEDINSKIIDIQEHIKGKILF